MHTNIKKDFPFFQKHQELTYLDSAATAQKPTFVIQAVEEYLQSSVANPERGSYELAEQVAARVEDIRMQATQFIHAPRNGQLIFTGGTTAGLNLLAQGLEHYLSSKDEVLVYPSDHQACVAPWMQTAAKILHYQVDPYTGLIDTESILSQVSNATKVVVVTHSHNIFGVVNDIATLKKMLPQSCLLIVDSAQTVGHVPVNVEELGADAVVFSGHKMFSLEGVGVLWVSERLYEILKPVQFGGGLNAFEPGTRNTTGIVSLGAALHYIEEIGIGTIEEHIQALSRYAVRVLGSISGLEFLPGFAFEKKLKSTGIISFNLSNRASLEVADQLNQQGICVRAGLHCSYQEDPMYNSVRLSTHIYSTTEDIDTLAEALIQK